MKKFSNFLIKTKKLNKIPKNKRKKKRKKREKKSKTRIFVAFKSHLKSKVPDYQLIKITIFLLKFRKKKTKEKEKKEELY